MLFKKMAEIEQGRLVRYGLLHEVYAHELPHGVAVIDSVLRPGVGQVEPDLQKVHPQHLLDPHRRTAPLALGVVGADDVHPFIPGDDLVHDLQKFLPLRLFLAEAVFDVRERLLFHAAHRLCVDGSSITYFVGFVDLICSEVP